MKPSHFLPILLLLSLTISGLSQTFDLSWEKQSGLRGIDFYTDVIEDRNEGYTVLGSKKTKDNSLDLWIVRLNEDGDSTWTKTLGTEQKDIPKKIIQLSDKSYMVLGAVQEENKQIPLLLKIDENGNEQWRKFLNDNEYVKAEDIISLEEGRFAVAGGKGTNRENLKLWMATMNTKGEIIWEKTFQNNLNGCARSIKKLPDGGFAIAGQVGASGKKDCDIMAFRTDEEGKAKWFSWIKTPGQKVWPECICCSPDSCFMVVGWKGKCMDDINLDNPVFDFDITLNKINCKGEILWTKSFDREGSEGGNAVTIRPDGNFIVAGIKATSFLGKVGPWLLKVDTEGNELNEKLLKFRFINDHAARIINCSDGGFVVIGPGLQDDTNTRSDGWIMKFKSL